MNPSIIMIQYIVIHVHTKLTSETIDDDQPWECSSPGESCLPGEGCLQLEDDSEDESDSAEFCGIINDIINFNYIIILSAFGRARYYSSA